MRKGLYLLHAEGVAVSRNRFHILPVYYLLMRLLYEKKPLISEDLLIQHRSIRIFGTGIIRI